MSAQPKPGKEKSALKDSGAPTTGGARVKGAAWLAAATPLLVELGCGPGCQETPCGAEAYVRALVDGDVDRVDVELCRNGECGRASLDVGDCALIRSSLEVTACASRVGGLVQVELTVLLRATGDTPRDGDEYSVRVWSPDGTLLAEHSAPATYDEGAPSGAECSSSECKVASLVFEPT